MKSIVSMVLLLFVAVSVVYLIVGETRKSSVATPTGVAPAPTATSNGESPTKAEEPVASEAAPEARTVVYYFHGTMRCPTCLRMERYAREAVEESFAAEIDAGLVEWQSVNYDEPANEHFVQEYGLSASALVLVSTGTGSAKDWQNLERIWDLSGDEYGFKTYVADAVRSMLGGA